jgi:glycosyltransferase involved in cell wall biosynthesis
VSHGVSVDIATTDDNGAGQLKVPLGRPVVEHGVTYWYFRRQIRFYTFSWPLFDWLATHVGDYDLVHIHALFSFPATVGAFWASRRGVPYLVRPLGILNTWGMRTRRPFLKSLSLPLIERRILANAAAVHFTSEQERCEAELIAPGTRSVVIPNPVAALGIEQKATSESFRSKYPELAGKLVVLFLSRLDPKKGLDLLLDGFAKTRAVRADAILVLAGNGDDGFVARLREQVQKLAIQRDVIWAGFLEGEDKRAAFAAADVFVLPSYSENFGIAVVEAMASGLPVIISDQVGIHRAVTRSKAGLVVQCDANEVQQALIEILASQEERDQMGRNGRWLAGEYSPTAVTARLLETYQNLARGNSSVHDPAMRAQA